MAWPIVNPLTALDYAGHGIHLRRFSQSIAFFVNIARPVHRAPSRLVDVFIGELSEQAKRIGAKLAECVNPRLKRE